MSSYCYLVLDEIKKRCIIIDPGSEKSEREIAFIENNKFVLDYIILTHEHVDHTWGVNALIEKYPMAKVICSSMCRDGLPGEVRLFFQLYYDDSSYAYDLRRVDYTTEELNWKLVWGDYTVVFIPTPGHTPGSICISLDGALFGGDSLLQFKPYIRKRNGGSMQQFKDSVNKILKKFPDQTLVYPGHGDPFKLVEYKQ